MPTVSVTFFFVAVVILLGFLTAKTFQLTRVPDIPILLSFGLLLGPLNRAAVEHGLGGSDYLVANLNVTGLKTFAPFISALALIVILFDSGLKLDFAQFGRSMRPAFLHTLPTFLLTVLLIALTAGYFFGMPPLISVVLGVALSNVGQTVSAALLRGIHLDAEVRSIYFVEMAIYDLISIPLLVSLLEFAQGTTVGADIFAQSLAKVISISVLTGLGGGAFWIWVLLKLRERTYAYMITLAALLLVYSLNTFLGGSGPVSVLIFGLVIGNRERVMLLVGLPAGPSVQQDLVHIFHDEITFFVRAFYFIFLGITFSTGTVAGQSLHPRGAMADLIDQPAAAYLLGVVLIFTSIVVARYAVVRWLSSRRHPERMGLFAVYGRGLGTAVLATYPFNIAAYQPGTYYYTLFSPWEAVFVNTALLIILLTVLGTTITVFRQEVGAATSRPAGGVEPKATAKE